jgi:Protein of unknown function (DUF1698)
MKTSLQVVRDVGWALLRGHISPQRVVDRYIDSAPSPQNAINIFKGEWSSRLPGSYANLSAGQIRLFEDDRIQWAISEFGDVGDRTVLELGPLEGGHSYMLEKAGFGSVLAIEGNTRAYLKCLVIKEMLRLSRVQFLCGDFVEYLRHASVRFDCVLASGVLYHMIQPVELLSLLSHTTDRLFLWTHYYDPRHPKSRRFRVPREVEYAGFKHTLYPQEYGPSLVRGGFCGGSRPFSHWMTRDDILACLQFFGFDSIRTNFEELHHSNGPAFALVATRTRTSSDQRALGVAG